MSSVDLGSPVMMLNPVRINVVAYPQQCNSILRGTLSVNTALRYINDAETEKMPRLLEN